MIQAAQILQFNIPVKIVAHEFRLNTDSSQIDAFCLHFRHGPLQTVFGLNPIHISDHSEDFFPLTSSLQLTHAERNLFRGKGAAQRSHIDHSGPNRRIGL